MKWDETDFLDCLEVFPEIEEDDVSYAYKVMKNGMVLTVVVWPWESLVLMSLRQQEMETSIIEILLCVREGVRYIKDKRGNYLEFQDCVFLPVGASHQLVEDAFDKTRFGNGAMVQLTIKPHIQIRQVRD
jgi:hypothetical protein